MVPAMTAPLTAQTRDCDLIDESRARPEAFAALFDRYSGMLYRYVSRRLGPEIAEDLVGETFLVAFARRSHYDLAYADARPWLFGIATRLVSRHHRTEAARYRALRRSPAEDVAESPTTGYSRGSPPRCPARRSRGRWPGSRPETATSCCWSPGATCRTWRSPERWTSRSAPYGPA